MGWAGFLALWCALWAVVALIGFGMSLAGVTKAQRTVRLAGRVERVREPRHGGSRMGGISVVVAYTDPVTGQAVTVTNDGERGEMITEAWEGREVGINHPRGRPHAYRFTNRPEEPSRGLGRPSFALFLVYVGLVVLSAVHWAWPWALIGFGGPLALFAAAHLPATIRARNDHAAKLAAMEHTEGRVVAVLRDVSVDQDDGHTYTTITPVVSFTTHEGTAVTAHCTSHLPDPAGAYGREVTVHYTRADPADFTVDRAAERRSQNQDVTFNVLTIAVMAATGVVGVLFLVG
ncbi:DUF3592 domain-containing protein [Streptomyces sp. NPDC051913]|uniref:DUF3592 domain-containing protein n=1 Tax=Streptomyces sp. NPDC051913 TaxID=3365676 RepID=UPI0037D7C68F